MNPASRKSLASALILWHSPPKGNALPVTSWSPLLPRHGLNMARTFIGPQLPRLHATMLFLGIHPRPGSTCALGPACPQFLDCSGWPTPAASACGHCGQAQCPYGLHCHHCRGSSAFDACPRHYVVADAGGLWPRGVDVGVEGALCT